MNRQKKRIFVFYFREYFVSLQRLNVELQAGKEKVRTCLWLNFDYPSF